jgi:transcriptional repressor NrdR
MKCPFCRSDQTEVYNSRSTRSTTQIWRRRRCLACHEAFTTYERPDLSFLHVRGQTAKKTRYSRSTLFSAVYAAFGDQERNDQTIDAVTDTIETKLLDLKSSIVTTEQISGIILSTLKHFETPAFLRYLASHADLASASRLRRELKKY